MREAISKCDCCFSIQDLKILQLQVVHSSHLLLAHLQEALLQWPPKKVCLAYPLLLFFSVTGYFSMPTLGIVHFDACCKGHF
jgi:hypothetical protein